MENLLFEVIVTPIIMEIKKVFKLYFKLNLKCRCHLRYFNVAIGVIPSFSSKRGHEREKHVLMGCKHDMLGNQTFEV